MLWLQKIMKFISGIELKPELSTTRASKIETFPMPFSCVDIVFYECSRDFLQMT